MSLLIYNLYLSFVHWKDKIIFINDKGWYWVWVNKRLIKINVEERIFFEKYGIKKCKNNNKRKEQYEYRRKKKPA